MAGRPTKYTDEMPDRAREYLKNYQSYGDVCPHIEGIADVCEVTVSTVYNWAKEHPVFLETLNECNALQARVLKNKGLGGEFQPTIAKLMLANHGYHDKAETQLTGKDGGPVEQSITINWVQPDDGD